MMREGLEGMEDILHLQMGSRTWTTKQGMRQRQWLTPIPMKEGNRLLEPPLLERCRWKWFDRFLDDFRL